MSPVGPFQLRMCCNPVIFCGARLQLWRLVCEGSSDEELQSVISPELAVLVHLHWLKMEP